MPTLQYTYNADGQRVQTVESGVTKKQVWDEENILLETDGSDVTQVVYTHEPDGYGNLLSQRRGSTSSYYQFDALGSTRRLVSSAGVSTDRYEYRAFGELYAPTGSTVNVFRWVGQQGYYYDVDREAYYVRARHYSPKQGRWISQDPIGFEGSEWNLYEYAVSLPVIHTDSSGLLPFFPPWWQHPVPPQFPACSSPLEIILKNLVRSLNLPCVSGGSWSFSTSVDIIKTKATRLGGCLGVNDFFLSMFFEPPSGSGAIPPSPCPSCVSCSGSQTFSSANKYTIGPITISGPEGAPNCIVTVSVTIEYSITVTYGTCN